MGAVLFQVPFSCFNNGGDKEEHINLTLFLTSVVVVVVVVVHYTSASFEDLWLTWHRRTQQQLFHGCFIGTFKVPNASCGETNRLEFHREFTPQFLDEP